MTPKPFTYYIWRNKLSNKRTTRKHANNFYKSPPRDSQQQVWEKKSGERKKKISQRLLRHFSKNKYIRWLPNHLLTIFEEINCGTKGLSTRKHVLKPSSGLPSTGLGEKIVKEKRKSHRGCLAPHKTEYI